MIMNASLKLLSYRLYCTNTKTAKIPLMLFWWNSPHNINKIYAVFVLVHMWTKLRPKLLKLRPQCKNRCANTNTTKIHCMLFLCGCSHRPLHGQEYEYDITTEHYLPCLFSYTCECSFTDSKKHRKHEAFTKCCLNVGPPSTTVTHHSNNIGSSSHFVAV